MQKLKNNKSLTYAIVIAIILLLLDQITKVIIINNNFNMTIIKDILNIHTVQNTGGAFGVGEGNTGMFIITNLVVLGLIIRFIYLQKDFMDKATLYTLFVILAGGFGNLIDRLSRGYVIDFINIFPSTNFPKFNLADIYITVGWTILAFIFAMYSYKEIKNSKKLKR
ncbi:MAG: signal peptidase II [Clostridia bacterium]|nr:signal peptidase II [Clostridia bacterium]